MSGAIIWNDVLAVRGMADTGRSTAMQRRKYESSHRVSNRGASAGPASWIRLLHGGFFARPDVNRVHTGQTGRCNTRQTDIRSNDRTPGLAADNIEAPRTAMRAENQNTGRLKKQIMVKQRKNRFMAMAIRPEAGRFGLNFAIAAASVSPKIAASCSHGTCPTGPEVSDRRVSCMAMNLAHFLRHPVFLGKPPAFMNVPDKWSAESTCVNAPSRKLLPRKRLDALDIAPAMRWLRAPHAMVALKEHAAVFAHLLSRPRQGST